MSISSTDLYGASTIVNTDLFSDVETLKEEMVTLSTTYLQTTAEHRTDISQNKFNISENTSKPYQFASLTFEICTHSVMPSSSSTWHTIKRSA